MATTAISLEQFLGDPEKEGVKRELDEGTIVEMASPSRQHQVIVSSVIRAIGSLSGFTPDWEVGPGLSFVLAEDCVRVPDVYLANLTTLDSMEVRPGNAHVGAPELAIEVASPSDSIVDFDRKVKQYLAAGAKAVWIVFIETRHVYVVHPDESVENRRPGEEIDLSDVVPDAKIEVDAIFAGLRD